MSALASVPAGPIAPAAATTTSSGAAAPASASSATAATAAAALASSAKASAGNTPRPISWTTLTPDEGHVLALFSQQVLHGRDLKSLVNKKIAESIHGVALEYRAVSFPVSIQREPSISSTVRYKFTRMKEAEECEYVRSFSEDTEFSISYQGRVYHIKLKADSEQERDITSVSMDWTIHENYLPLLKAEPLNDHTVMLAGSTHTCFFNSLTGVFKYSSPTSTRD